MPKRTVPASLQIIIFLMLATAGIIGGYYFMRAQLIHAKLDIDEEGFTVINNSNMDWPKARFSLNQKDSAYQVNLPALDAEETYEIPYSKFRTIMKREGQSSVTIDDIWIHKMAGYHDRKISVSPIMLKTE